MPMMVSQWLKRFSFYFLAFICKNMITSSRITYWVYLFLLSPPRFYLALYTHFSYFSNTWRFYLNIYTTTINIFVKKRCSNSNNDVKKINKHNGCFNFHNFTSSNAYLASLLHMWKPIHKKFLYQDKSASSNFLKLWTFPILVYF